MRVVITGAHGFLGWHLRARLRAMTPHDVVPVGRTDWQRLPEFVDGADAVIHIAGINRGEPSDVEGGNAQLAGDLAVALRSAARVPAVINANSVQSGNGTPYGTGKARASATLADAAAELAAPYTDVVLPNLFGEGGRADYNSFVATFVERIISGRHVDLQDREIELLHAQEAAQAFMDALRSPGGERRPIGVPTSVSHVGETLARLFAAYRLGEIPELRSPLDVSLLNTLRAKMFSIMPTVPLVRRSDARGSLVETVRAHGSEGQAFVSTTRPGVTRGQHFHLRKLERFAVIEGIAEIAVRKLFSDSVMTYRVTGDDPVAIDMPTGWPHKITNIGDSVLTTLFWTNELFDAADTDTYPEEV